MRIERIHVVTVGLILAVLAVLALVLVLVARRPKDVPRMSSPRAHEEKTSEAPDRHALLDSEGPQSVGEAPMLRDDFRFSFRRLFQEGALEYLFGLQVNGGSH